MSCADDPRKRFWTNLADANIEDGPSGFQYLTLQPGTYFLDPSRKISSILLRPCYKDLWNLVLESACVLPLNPFGFLVLFNMQPCNACETLTGKDLDAGPGNFIITGTSGVGKTLWQYYAMYNLAKMGATVVVDFQKMIKCLCFSK